MSWTLNAQNSQRISYDEHKYTLRLDLITESQIDDLIAASEIPLLDACEKVMGFTIDHDGTVLREGDRIRLFKDERIENIQLINKSGRSRKVISEWINTQDTQYLHIPLVIDAVDHRQYFLVISLKES